MKLYFLALIAAFSLTSCDEGRVKIKDGRVPSEYLSQVTPYMGEYSGAFEGIDSTMSLRMDGDKPVLQFLNTDGSKQDIIGEHCQSKIGNLKWISANKAGSEFYADFDFNPNQCRHRVEGRKLTLDFITKDGKLDRVSIGVLEWQKNPDCRRTCIGSGVEEVCTEHCDDPISFSVLKGTYRR